MRAHFRNLLALGGILALPCPILAQTAPAATIIACEGPNMPAACPQTDGAPRSLAAERLDVARREGLTTLQAQQMIAQRQALVRGVTPPAPRPLPAGAYQSLQPNPYLAPVAPPDFKGAAQIVGNVISGGPHN